MARRGGIRCATGAWTGNSDGARQWATVTPYVLDRHAKSKDKAAYQAELADSIRQSWGRVRQSPAVSAEVVITPVSAHLGCAPRTNFHGFSARTAASVATCTRF